MICYICQCRALDLLVALVTRRPYCPGGSKKLCFTTLSLIPMVSIARLSVVKQSSFGLPGQYVRRLTRVNFRHCGCNCCFRYIFVRAFLTPSCRLRYLSMLFVCRWTRMLTWSPRVSFFCFVCFFRMVVIFVIFAIACTSGRKYRTRLIWRKVIGKNQMHSILMSSHGFYLA